MRRTSSLPQLSLIHDGEKTEEKQPEKGVKVKVDLIKNEDIKTEHPFDEEKIQKSKKRIRFLEIIEEDFSSEVFL